jgi:hypothetical protein
MLGCSDVRMPFQLPDSEELPSELDWINQLASALSNSERGKTLQAIAELLISNCILSDRRDLTYEEREDAVAWDLKKRMQRCRGNAFADDPF